MRTVEWRADRLHLIDQRQLPWELVVVEYETYQEVAHAIKDMVVRGAPAIGVAAAYGIALASRQTDNMDVSALQAYVQHAAAELRETRPTAVNLMWAVDRMLQVVNSSDIASADDLRHALLQEAQRLAEEDVETNKRISAQGAALIQNGDTILHHCNTGFLATVDYGTALGAIRMAHEQGKNIHVLLDETRPRMQGARLSAWECKTLGIPFDVLPDTAAGYYMQKGEVKIVLVGADRIAANGDVANKIGTYQIAVLAKENGIPFYSAAPTSTIDLSLKNGSLIPIEQRSADEVRAPNAQLLFPSDYPVRNPAFDVTPARYLTGIITENGVAYPSFEESLPLMCGK